jgi:hypothetical protein
VEFIVCPGCGMRVQPDKGHRCPECHTFLHPDPLRRREADLADRFRRWFLEELPTIEWLRPPGPPLSDQIVQQATLEKLVTLLGTGRMKEEEKEEGLLLKMLVFQDAKEHMQQTIRRYVGGVYHDSLLSVGVAFAAKRLVVSIGQTEVILKLQFWVMGREKRFRFLLPKFCFAARGALFAFNMDDYRRFAEVGEWVRMVKANTDSIPAVLVGILPEEKPVQEVTADDIDVFNKPYQFPYVEIRPTTDLAPIVEQLSLEMLGYVLERRVPKG